MPRRSLIVIATCALLGCGSDESSPATSATRPLMDFSADLTNTAQFYDFPYPADRRLDENGSPDLSGFLNARDNVTVNRVRALVSDRRGWGTIAGGYARFDGPLMPYDAAQLIEATPTAPVLLVDIDPASPERGRLHPVMAATLSPDDYVPDNLLGFAARPGFVLHPNRSYAFVLTRALLDEGGQPVAPAAGLAALDDGSLSADELDAYEPLWPALDAATVARDQVVAATVFTTGDVVAETAALGDAVRDAYDVTIDDLAVASNHDRFCELRGRMTLPQFQRGTPPFDEQGSFEIGADGLPIHQRDETIPVVVTLPKQAMPAGGYPLVMYFHGSGGISTQVVDRGAVPFTGGVETPGEGPAHVLAAHGFATVGSAHPVNPERLPGASALAYLNFDNLAAFRDTFRQGVLEQRLYLDALLELRIDPTLVSACSGLSLPSGETAYRFASAPVMAMGQSMGGMYTNMVAATDARIEAVVPTGAGGLWGYFILNTDLISGETLVPILLGGTPKLNFLHPTLQLLELAWEAAETFVYMPRLARRPLDGHPVRSVYEPVGRGDVYFSTDLFDAAALAYGNQQAGDQVWASMQPTLALAGLDGVADYPVVANRQSEGGTPYTGAVVQYADDGILNAHYVFAQLDAIKHQYGCFFESFVTTGQAVVAAPAALGSGCP
jgi:hypothetical protein